MTWRRIMTKSASALASIAPAGDEDCRWSWMLRDKARNRSSYTGIHERWPCTCIFYFAQICA